MSNHYQVSTELMCIIGEDFSYVITNKFAYMLNDNFLKYEASKNFRNYDMLIEYINARPEEFNLNLFYSTPTE